MKFEYITLWLLGFLTFVLSVYPYDKIANVLGVLVMYTAVKFDRDDKKVIGN